MGFEARWQRFATSDLDQAHEFMSAAYVELKIHTTCAESAFRLRASAGHMVDVPISRLHYSARTRLSTAPNTDLIIAHIHSGRYALLGERDGYAVPRGRCVLLPPDQAIDVEIEDFDLTAVRLPRRLVEDVAEASTGLPAHELRFHSARPLSPRLEQSWLKTVAYAGGLALGENDLDDNPMSGLLLCQARRQLAAAFLAAFPSTALDVVPRTERVAPAALRRAIAYMEQNAHRDLPVTEVARAVNLSARGLQDAFRRHRQTTPREFLRRLRLERAHRQLQAADPTAGDTVQSIARRWGFDHPGRFAGYYRAAYGHSPRRTLLS